MKTRRSNLFLAMKNWWLLPVVAGALFGDVGAKADGTVSLACVNDYIPPLLNINFPEYPQVLNAEITILTNAATNPSNNVTHSVLVIDPNSFFAPNKAIFYFTINSDGTVTGPNAQPSVLVHTPNSTQTSYSTIIGIYSFPGDNFPFAAPTTSYQFPPVTNQRQFLLDDVTGMTLTPQNSSTLTIQSNYSYTRWALTHGGIFSFLGQEGPYTPGASAAGPVAEPVTFDFRGGVKQSLGPAPSPGQFVGQPTTSCPDCGCSKPSPSPAPNKAMAGASLDRFQAAIAITDTPISYTPGVGMNMAFTVKYHQRLSSQPTTFNYSNLGPQWSGSWISYIEGGPTSGQSSATYHAPDGSPYTYDGYQQTVVQSQGGTIINQGDFQGTEAWTHATLHYRQNPEQYDRWLPDGTVEVYSQPAGTTASNRLFFLTLITDPQGNTTTLAYDPTAAANGQAVLTSVTDPEGGQLLFSYDTANPLEIVKVTRSNDGLSAKFQYNSSGLLTSITDPIGITSSFRYTSGTTFINRMTTPYGNTTFSSTDGPGYLEADMTNPLGQTERVEYQESLSTSLFPATESSTPTGVTVDNTNLNQANSFYWTRRAIADATAGSIATDSSGFYALAQVTHWAQSGQGSIPVPLSTKMPLEGRVWYNYPGQVNVDFVITNASSASTSPSATARVLDGGATQASYATYNANGMITQSIDPIGRTTNYNYDTNGIDLLTVKQVNGGGQDLLSSMSNYIQHEPQTIVDASGQTTTLGYNGVGQLLTRTVVVNSSNQTTTLAYYTNGYLHTVTGPVTGATTTYTYDSTGRVHTVTDSEGYVLTMAYDNLDRPTSTLYPDSTTDQTFYNKLDVDHTVDRQSRVTKNSYDAIRELLSTTDPLGRSTKYTWCTCGGLSTLIDANGNVTTWGLDLQGRVTSKTYADSSAIHYVYETNTSRLHTMTDARNNVATYSYNVDNTLSGTAYSPGSGVAATPNVSFAYDTVYNRVTGMTDGTGTTTYNYNPINAALGAGRLSSVSVPIAGSTATVTYKKSDGITAGYDELGRVVGRGVDQSTTNANNVATTFDTLGRVTGVTNALGAFTYAYVNTTSRLSTVTDPVGTGGTGLSLNTTYSYFNNAGDQRLQEIKNLLGTTPLSKFDYTYNAVGTIATWTQQADSSTAVVNTLSYDGADQLTNAAQSGGGSASNAYHYDPAGNRLSETTASGTTGGQFNNLNQLTALGGTTSQTVSGHSNGNVAITSATTVNTVPATISNSTNFTANVPLPNGSNVVTVVAQPSSSSVTPLTQRYGITVTGTAPPALSYDANGNVLTDENGNTYTWDALNRLIAIAYHSGTYSGTHTEFAYDGLSRRVQIVERAGTTVGSGTVSSTKNYLWIGSEIAEERDASNAVTKRFFPQGEQQIVSGTATPYYYTSDHLGSIREMCNSSGTIVSRLSYDPYGKITVVSGTNLPTFEYAGYYQHQVSGLQLAVFRGYDPNTGRWLSRDPIGEIAGGFDLYEYCRDTPIGVRDILGLRGTVPSPQPAPPSTPPANPAPAPQTPPATQPKSPTLPGVGRCSAWSVILYFVFTCPGDSPASAKAGNGAIIDTSWLFAPKPKCTPDYAPVPPDKTPPKRPRQRVCIYNCSDGTQEGGIGIICDPVIVKPGKPGVTCVLVDDFWMP